MFGFGGVLIAGDADRHPQVGALIAGKLEFQGAAGDMPGNLDPS